MANEEGPRGADHDRARLAMLRVALDEQLDTFFLFDPRAGRAIEWNRAFSNLTGYSDEEIRALPAPQSYYGPEDLARAIPFIDVVLENGTGTIELDLVCKDGRKVPTEYTVAVVRDADGAPEAFISIGRDVTARRAAEAARRESERRLATLMRNLPGVAYRCRNDQDWTMEFMSEGALRLTGYAPHELVDNHERSYGDLVHPDDAAMVWQEVQAAVHARRGFEIDYRIRHRDGSERWVSEQGLPVEGERDGDVVLEGYIADITPLRSLRSQLQHAHKMEAIGRLAGGIAHEFNNILTVIQNGCELLGDQLPAHGEAREDVETMQRTARRATQLTRQLLAFGRKQVILPQDVDLNLHVERTADLLRPMLEENVSIDLEVHASPGLVWFDPGQLDQVLLDLAVNARDAMPRGGGLRIATSGPIRDPITDIAFVRLEVHDSGEGLDPDTVSQLFEPFFTTTRLKKGTGLGLATVYGIVRQHGGSIEVRSTDGVGTTFTVLLPTAAPRSATASHGPVLGMVESTPPPASLRGTETILLVEDEDAVRDVARRILTGLGYEVLTAHDAKTAIDIAKARVTPLDLLLSDVVMPGASGVECASQLRAMQPDLRVVLMSGHPQDTLAPHYDARVAGLSFVQKPFTGIELATRVRSVLDAASK